MNLIPKAVINDGKMFIQVTLYRVKSYYLSCNSFGILYEEGDI